MDSAISKTTYELLSVSDSDSDARQQMQEIHFKSPRRKRLRKRLPSNRVRRYESIQNPTCCHTYGRLLSLSFIIVILCCWLLILSWLVVIFNDELRRFDSNIMAIVAGNRGIPESVRQCHSQTIELQKNQSDMNMRISSLTSLLNNLSKEISQISNDLKSVQHKISVSPVPPHVPTDIKEFSDDVRNWISELNDTVAQLKQSEDRLKDGFQTLTFNVTSLKEKLSLLDKVPMLNISAGNTAGDLQQLIYNLTSSVTYLNTTLSDDINLVKRNHSDDHLLIENLDSLSHNISQRLNQLHEEYQTEHTQFASLSNIVKNLTDRFNLTSSQMTKLYDEMNTLKDGVKRDKSNGKIEEISTTVSTAVN